MATLPVELKFQSPHGDFGVLNICHGNDASPVSPSFNPLTGILVF